MRRLMMITLAVMFSLVLISIPTLTKTDKQTIAAIDYEAACQQCKDNAWAEWDQCWRVYNDEGDADCRMRREDALVQCETSYCIFITQSNQSQPDPWFTTVVNLLAPTTCASDFCGECQGQCNEWADTHMDACVRSGSDWYFCADSRNKFMRNCGVQDCPTCRWVEFYSN